MIHDVKITPLKIIPDERGKVMHMLRKDSPIFDKFGEIYIFPLYTTNQLRHGTYIKNQL